MTSLYILFRLQNNAVMLTWKESRYLGHSGHPQVKQWQKFGVSILALNSCKFSLVSCINSFHCIKDFNYYVISPAGFIALTLVSAFLFVFF